MIWPPPVDVESTSGMPGASTFATAAITMTSVTPVEEPGAATAQSTAPAGVPPNLALPANPAQPGQAFDLSDFFSGHTTAYGIFEDRFGRIRRRFDGLFVGRWSGDEFVLNETFTFDDGEVESRIWRLKPVRDGRFTATTPDCIGTANCEAFAQNTRMRYRFNLKLKRRTVPVRLDDRIYRVDDYRAVNRCRVSKWGIKLGELTIFLERRTATS
jgi:hypothetical protein